MAALSMSATLGSVKPLAQQARKPARATRVVTRAAAVSGEVPDMGKRQLMNALLLGAVGAPVAALAGGFAYFFVPPSAGGGSAGQIALDANGDAVTTKKWLATHQAGDHSLVQGLKGDATYLIVKKDGTITDYGLNAVCTHLGCVVPWNSNENKFKCPCHGSQYNDEGKVIRGPAPLSLALAHLNIDAQDNVVLSTWTETDFRTGLAPWWK